MRTRPTRRPPTTRGVTMGIAALTALAMAVPAAAQDGPGAWPQAGADGAGTYQSGADGPSDPGLKWIQDLDDVGSGTAAPDGFSIPGSPNPPVFGADGTIMLRAGAVDQSVGEGNSHLIGIDPDDGSLAWNLPYALSGCSPAVDSQGRGWGMFVDGAGHEDTFNGITDPFIEAFDPATGERDGASSYEPISEVEAAQISWCRNTSIHIGGSGDNERAILFDGRGSGQPGILAIDISGSQASEAWVIDPDDAPYGRVMRATSQEQIGAISDDSLYVPTVTGSDLELVEISLASGEVTNRVELPVYDEDDGDNGDASTLFSASVLLDGDTAVISAQTATATAGVGAIHGVDTTGTWNTPAWSQPFEDQASTQRGPRSVALSNGTVVSQSGASPDKLYAHNTATGTPTSWSGTGDTLQSGREPGQIVTDNSGNIYAAVRGPSGGRADRSVAAYAPDGTQLWRFNRQGLSDASGLEEGGELEFLFDVRAIDGDGTLYLQRDAQLVAIDSSGGLAVGGSFPDVNPDNVHADNIERLVQRGITTGDTAGNYNPGGPVTRAQFATFLVRSLGEDAFPSDPVGAVDMFIDVNPDSVHADNIYAVAAAGITTGVTETTFEPNTTLDRAQMASLLVRAFELEDRVSIPGDTFFPSDIFDDVEEGNVHSDNIWVVAELEISTGTSETTYNPSGPVQRDQLASFLMRTLDRIQPEGGGDDLF